MRVPGCWAAGPSPGLSVHGSGGFPTSCAQQACGWADGMPPVVGWPKRGSFASGRAGPGSRETGRPLCAQTWARQRRVPALPAAATQAGRLQLVPEPGWGYRIVGFFESAKQALSCWPLLRYWSCRVRRTSAACAVLRCRRKPNQPAALLLLASAQSAKSWAGRVPIAMPRRPSWLPGCAPGLGMGKMTQSASAADSWQAPPRH